MSRLWMVVAKVARTALQAGLSLVIIVAGEHTPDADLQSLTGDVGGRAAFAKHAVAYVPWHDASLLLDVNTPQDYACLQKLEDQSV